MRYLLVEISYFIVYLNYPTLILQYDYYANNVYQHHENNMIARLKNTELMVAKQHAKIILVL